METCPNAICSRRTATTLGCQAGNGLPIQGAKQMVIVFRENFVRWDAFNPPFLYFVCILDGKFCGRGNLYRKKSIQCFTSVEVDLMKFMPGTVYTMQSLHQFSSSNPHALCSPKFVCVCVLCRLVNSKHSLTYVNT